ncbi:ANKRD50 [Symbiodinium natans]|uniref:ANKRD50 protein n=1 Tax=Symbiodinium natans TaxID=878477 RepID=A0A812NIS3_9DINO|nr:ANKRD50 [Symbiodinium natans]
MPGDAAPAVLRILRVSGEEVAALSEDQVEELWNELGSTVKALKQHLLRLPAFTGMSIYRLRLVHEGELMPDSQDCRCRLYEGPIELSVVVLDFVALEPSDQRRVLTAVHDGTVAAVDAFLQMPVDPNDIFEEFDPNLDNLSETHASLLWLAASRGNVDVARLLLEARADVNLVNAYGTTPLSAAITYHGDWDTVQLLIKANSDIGHADDDGCTPVWLSAERGRVKIAELLILLGADPQRADHRGQTPLLTACARCQWEFVKFLLLPQLSLQEPVDANQADDYGRTPLWFAAENGEFSIVNLLLFAGADKNKATDSGQTPLWIAASRGHLNTVQLLMMACADREKTDENDLCPAAVAEQNGHPDIGQLLRTWQREV